MENAILKLNHDFVQGWENAVIKINHTVVQGCVDVIRMYTHKNISTVMYTKLWVRHVEGYHIIRSM